MAGRITRRNFIKQGSAAAAAMTLPKALRACVNLPFDLVIKGATILDGTGGPPWRSDVGIVGDRIDALGAISAEQAARVIDATGLHLSPGFIDIHTHSDGSIRRAPTADSRVYQGITTEITGNCGGSAAPRAARAARGRRGEGEGQARPTTVASYFDRLEEVGMSVNHAMLLGQGTLRRAVAGQEDRRLSAEEMATVLRAVQAGMDDGAVGLSTGLEYTPGRWTPTEEIIAMARIVARRGGFYASHIRNEEANLLEAIHEAIDIGRQSGARVEISHLKAAGQPNWSKQGAALQLIESARQSGVDVLADAYPYPAYSTGLSILMETWTLEGGTDETVKRLKNPTDRARIRAEVAANIKQDPGDYDLIVISRVRSEKNRPVVGKTLAEIANTWDVEPIDAYLRLMEEESASVSFIGHGMSPENVERVLSHPLVMIGSDGSSMKVPEGEARTRPHPRSYGTCARVLGYYARERKLFDLPTAIKKMTSMPADQVGLSDRGRIGRGKKADLVLFNHETVNDKATFDDPHQYAVGIPYVFVNGVAVVDNSKHTGATPGKVLRKS